MKKLIARIHLFVHRREGATAIEYGLIAGGISMAIFAVVVLLGTDLRNVFNALDTSMASVQSSTQTTGG
jgi:pilus assembly protein Flp/PilA